LREADSARALNSTRARAWVSRKSTHLSRKKFANEKRICNQSDPLGEEVARKFLGAQKLEKYRIKSGAGKRRQPLQNTSKSSQVEPKRLDRLVARWEAVIYTQSLS
jgi:hypothetical protein